MFKALNEGSSFYLSNHASAPPLPLLLPAYSTFSPPAKGRNATPEGHNPRRALYETSSGQHNEAASITGARRGGSAMSLPPVYLRKGDFTTSFVGGMYRDTRIDSEKIKEDLKKKRKERQARLEEQRVKLQAQLDKAKEQEEDKLRRRRARKRARAKLRHVSAKKIQKLWRNYNEFRTARRLQALEREQAALRIQTYMRGCRDIREARRIANIRRILKTEGSAARVLYTKMHYYVLRREAKLELAKRRRERDIRIKRIRRQIRKQGAQVVQRVFRGHTGRKEYRKRARARAENIKDRERRLAEERLRNARQGEMVASRADNDMGRFRSRRGLLTRQHRPDEHPPSRPRSRGTIAFGKTFLTEETPQPSPM
mmetsp:Transcript_35060/g.110319  ORF Transcript_35060/g.110319 Transcript_35060/m.110319 type:complete len:370 (-) Transcript_35060:922-2031(-)